mmetsp:Transcript_18837/g.38033  ORF Transcript_18837/g.38033 Transcript_18837/m.38033 type:complete len:631 (+) Transcript_18837:79-1971(+)
MSLLAMIADNFELEQPPADEEEEVDNDHECLLMDMNSTDDADATFTTAKEATSNSDDGSNEYVEYHDILKQNRNDSEGTAETEQSFDSTGSNNPHYDAVNTDNDNASSSRPSQDMKLLLTFLLMVVVGTGMKIFQKLQAIPMYNYPSSLNLIQNFIYVPLCFMYIIPVSRLGLFNNSIPNEVTMMSKRPFVIMGLLDCITCMLLTFSAVYLPGSLLILLPQAAIPISMFFSNRIKGDTYARYQYFGALVVIMGILVVLEPLVTQRHAEEFTCVAYNDEFCAACGEESTEEGCLSYGETTITTELDWNWKTNLHAYVAESSKSSSGATNASDHDGALCQWVSSASADDSSSSSDSTSTILIWSIVTILACIPMTLSSIYKEMALSGSETQIDPIFLNGWVAWYQFLFSFPLTIPAGMATGILPSELPSNIWDGIKCYLGISTITGGCHPDDLCSESPLYVNIFLVFNVAFNILLVFVLKFGSANMLFMAATIMVPIGNLAFALPLIPGSMPLHDSDIAGLLVILLGLVTYRFGSSFKCRRKCKRRSGDENSAAADDEGNLFSPGSVLPFSPDGVRRYARTLLNGGDSAYEDFYLDSPYEEENESDFKGLRMPRSLIRDLEEPLLTPVESIY